jgi:hypothetical protein
MKLPVAQEVAALQRLTTRQLRAKFAELCDETTPSSNRTWLIKRLAWRLQALAEGGLSERARRRAAELANEADLRLAVPRTPRTQRTKRPPPQRQQPNHLLPMPGTVLTRPYKGQTLQVQVQPDGFQFDGHTYRSLSAVAKAITGSHCSGRLFFRLNGTGGGR